MAHVPACLAAGTACGRGVRHGWLPPAGGHVRVVQPVGAALLARYLGRSVCVSTRTLGSAQRAEGAAGSLYPVRRRPAYMHRDAVRAVGGTPAAGDYSATICATI